MTKKVYEAIANVTAAMASDGIGKDRKNTQQNYSFRGIDDVYNALSRQLARHKLCVLPKVIERESVERQTQKGGVLFYVTVKVDFHFVSAEDASEHVVTTYGEAMDSGDKATNKAMSAAYKYAAMQAFCIPTEGDNDADATTHEVAAEPRDDVADRLAKALAEHGGSVRAIKAYLATGDLSMAAEAWAEIGEDGQRALWVAPSKGGPFTTDERNTMKSPDFTAALRNLKEHA